MLLLTVSQKDIKYKVLNIHRVITCLENIYFVKIDKNEELSLI